MLEAFSIQKNEISEQQFFHSLHQLVFNISGKSDPSRTYHGRAIKKSKAAGLNVKKIQCQSTPQLASSVSNLASKFLTLIRGDDDFTANPMDSLKSVPKYANMDLKKHETLAAKTLSKFRIRVASTYEKVKIGYTRQYGSTYTFVSNEEQKESNKDFQVLKLVETDEYSESGRGVYPDGLYRVLLQFNEIYKHLNVPFIVTENGVADASLLMDSNEKHEQLNDWDFVNKNSVRYDFIGIERILLDFYNKKIISFVRVNGYAENLIRVFFSNSEYKEFQESLFKISNSMDWWFTIFIGQRRWFKFVDEISLTWGE